MNYLISISRECATDKTLGYGDKIIDLAHKKFIAYRENH